MRDLDELLAEDRQQLAQASSEAAGRVQRRFLQTVPAPRPWLPWSAFAVLATVALAAVWVIRTEPQRAPDTSAAVFPVRSAPQPDITAPEPRVAAFPHARRTAHASRVAQRRPMAPFRVPGANPEEEALLRRIAAANVSVQQAMLQQQAAMTEAYEQSRKDFALKTQDGGER